MSLEAIMAIGTVKWFNAQKGFGFIQPDNGGPDVFVHISAGERAGMSNLTEGQKLNYEGVSERGQAPAGNLKPGCSTPRRVNFERAAAPSPGRPLLFLALP